MINFRYKALDRNRNEVSGYIEANSPRGAQDKLRDLGLLPLEVLKVGSAGGNFRLSVKDKIHFVNELHTMVASGVSVLEALDVILKHTKSSSIRQITSDLEEQIRNGGTLSGALSKYHDTFGDVIIGLCKAGEYSGRLSETLGRAVVLLRKEDKNKSRLKKLSVYPIIITAITILFTLYFGFKGFPTIIESSNIPEDQIPSAVKILVAACDAMKRHWIISIAGGFFIIKYLFKFLVNNTLAIVFNKVLLMFPQVKNCYLYLNLSSYFAILSTAYETGVTLPKALELSASTISDIDIKNTATEVQEMVTKGSSLSQAFTMSELLPDSWNAIIASGEISGEMGKMFKDISQEVDKTIDDAIEVMMQFFQPVLMLVVGTIIGIFSILIIQMTSAMMFNMF